MKNVVLYAGIAVLIYVAMQRRQKAAVTVSDPIDVTPISGGSSGVDSDCSLCTTVSQTLGTDSTITTSPQLPSPAADPIISYAVDRMDFTGPRILAQ